MASSFLVMQEIGHNIFENFTKEDYKRSRALFIGSILGTDMSKHFAELGKLKARLSSPEFDPSGSTDKDAVMYDLFHYADISNGTKQWDLC